MIRSLLLHPQRYYPNVVEHKVLPPGSLYSMAYGEVKSWYIDDSWFSIQWYKSKYMLPYCIEIEASEPLFLPIAIIHPDTHWQYALKGSCGIQKESGIKMILQSGEHHRLFVKRGEFLCYIPVGRHVFVGYTIATNWLEKHELDTLVDDCLFRSEALPISPVMLSELYYLLSHPKLKGIQQDTNIYASIGRLQHAHDIQQSSHQHVNHHALDKIQAIHHYIQLLIDNHQILPTVEEIVLKYSIPIDQLNKAHHKLFGSTLGQYIRDTRLKYAATLLKQGVSIKEITYLLHYHDIAAFSNAFKKKYGLAPSEYRQL